MKIFKCLSRISVILSAVLVLSPVQAAEKEDPFAGFSRTKKVINSKKTDPAPVRPSITDADVESNIKNKDLANDQILITATALIEKNRSREAAEFLWARVDKLNIDGLSVLGEIALKNNNSGDLKKIASVIIGKFPTAAEGPHYEGHAFILTHELPKASQKFLTAIENNKKFKPAYVGLAQTYFLRKNPLEERVVYQDMISIFGKEIDTLTRLCELNVRDGQNDQAIDFCKQAMALDPKIPENFVSYALVFKNQGDLEKFGKELKKVSEKFKQSELAQFEYGIYLNEKNDFAAAQPIFENCISIDPKSVRCLIGLTTSSVGTQKWESAYEALKKACRFGRKYSVEVRKALQVARTAKAKEWIVKLEELASNCVSQ